MPAIISNEWHGPFEITRVDYNSHNVHLRHGNKIIVTHVDKIKRAFEIKIPDNDNDDTTEPASKKK